MTAFCLYFTFGPKSYPKDAFLIWNIKSQEQSKYMSLLPNSALSLKIDQKVRILDKIITSLLLPSSERFTSSTLCLIISILSNLKSSRCHTSRACDRWNLLILPLANERSSLPLTWPIRAREMGKSQAIETYLKLPPHPKVSLTGFYSAIVIQVSISVTFSKFQFEKLNTNSSKFWVISPPCG